MYFKTLKSEKGFGLLHVLAVMVIVSVAIAGLFISIYFAKSKAIENYHYRKVLLGMAGKMDLIKSYNPDGDKIVKYENITEVREPIVLEHSPYFHLEATMSTTYPRREFHSDLSVASYVMYDELVLRMEWEESTGMFSIPNKRYVTLREDYFRRTTIE